MGWLLYTIVQGVNHVMDWYQLPSQHFGQLIIHSFLSSFYSLPSSVATEIIFLSSLFYSVLI